MPVEPEPPKMEAPEAGAGYDDNEEVGPPVLGERVGGGCDVEEGGVEAVERTRVTRRVMPPAPLT